jgi:carbonic anhydrase/acetyltransferase-like protein (isoleucine patch superfamily)
MSLIKSLNDNSPKIHQTAFIAPTAVIIGEVKIKEDASIWYGTVLRGDVGAITIGKRSNVQDLSVIHCTHNYSTTIVGDDVTVGHRAILHGCTVMDCSLIGMGAIVMDRAVIEKEVIVAAGSVVLENAVLQTGHLYAGIPAKKIKPLSDEQISSLKESATHYLLYKKWY